MTRPAENFRPRAVSFHSMTARTLAALIDAHAAALVLFARGWCGTPEDVVQVAFGKLARCRTPPHDPAAWLFRVVRNAAIDAGKAERRRRHREAAVARPERWFVETEVDGLDAAAAVAALERLPGELREVVVARLWGGMTLTQVAAAVGCSVSSAHRRYEAAIAELRVTLKEPCP